MRMIREAWGKTDRDGGGVHPLAHHCMDVAAVFGRMMELPIIRNRLETAAKAPLSDVDRRRGRQERQQRRVPHGAGAGRGRPQP